MAWRQLEGPEEKGEKAQEAVEWRESPPEEVGGILDSLCGPRAPSPCKAIMGTESPKAKHYLTAVNTQGQQCPWGGLQATSKQDPCSPSYGKF